MFETMTDFLDYLYDKCLNFYCPPNAYFCCADLMKSDWWDEYARASVDYIILAIHAILHLLVTYMFVGTFCYLCCQKKSDYERKRVVFITAFPKDESMLFGPTIMRLKHTCDIHLLCIIGEDLDCVTMRKTELWESCDALGIPRGHITIVKISEMSKGNLNSRSTRICRIILDHIEAMSMDEVYTYDIGFNKDLEHYSIFIGMSMLCLSNQIPPYCQVYMLESVNTIRKYTSFADVALSMLMNKHVFVASKSDHDIIKIAMAKHKTQRSWISDLFYALSSRYMFVNTYKLAEQEDIQLVLQVNE